LSLDIAKLILEKEFGKVLGIRKAIGEAALQQSVNPSVARQKAALTNNLFKMLKPLQDSPGNTQSSFHAQLSEIIDKAVDLRNDMTRELAMYSIWWFAGDRILKYPDFIECHGEGQTASLALCVWPALIRKTKNDDGEIKLFCVTRAKVELEYPKGVK
jgi:hypothetical protein